VCEKKKDRKVEERSEEFYLTNEEAFQLMIEHGD
jgi:hypothetical protein